jgi:hypothetical protein
MREAPSPMGRKNPGLSRYRAADFACGGSRRAIRPRHRRDRPGRLIAFLIITLLWLTLKSHN